MLILHVSVHPIHTLAALSATRSSAVATRTHANTNGAAPEEPQGLACCSEAALKLAVRVFFFLPLSLRLLL